VSTSCAHPIGWETFVAYFAGDLPSAIEAATEEHLMGCSGCAALGDRVASVTEAIRRTLPPVVGPEDLARLRARGARLKENPVQPGERSSAVFSRDVDVLLHRLGGLDLKNADRVALRLRPEGSDQHFLALPSVPFDATSSEVVIACSPHYAVFPPNIVAELDIHRGDVVTSVAYTLRHRFEAPHR
jgi:hypothetical protein